MLGKYLFLGTVDCALMKYACYLWFGVRKIGFLDFTSSAVVGEIDEELDERLDLSVLRADPLNPIVHWIKFVSVIPTGFLYFCFETVVVYSIYTMSVVSSSLLWILGRLLGTVIFALLLVLTPSSTTSSEIKRSSTVFIFTSSYFG
jgi:hypothetical protein